MKKLIFIIFILMIVSSVYGATRFYLPYNITAEVSPSWDYPTSWGVTGEATRWKCTTNKIYTSMTTKELTTNPGTTTSQLNVQFVSNPIAAQSIKGTVQGQLRGLENNNNCNAVSAVLIKIVSNNGAINRGNLLNLTYETNTTVTPPEYVNGTPTNRLTPPSKNLNLVTAESGDRIVIEIGVSRESQVKSTGQSFGDNSATDLTANNSSETTANNPWIEFSQDIRFPGVTVID